jgi:hypothetical protein
VDPLRRRQFLLTAATTFLNGYGVLTSIGKRSAPVVARGGILDGASAVDPVANDMIAGLKQGLAKPEYATTRIFVCRLLAGYQNTMPGVEPTDQPTAATTTQTTESRVARGSDGHLQAAQSASLHGGRTIGRDALQETPGS